MSAGRAVGARHVGVAAFIVNNNPETMERTRPVVSHTRRLLLRIVSLPIVSWEYGHKCRRRYCALALAETHDVKQPAGWAEREQNPSSRPASGPPWKTPSMRAWRAKAGNYGSQPLLQEAHEAGRQEAGIA